MVYVEDVSCCLPEAFTNLLRKAKPSAGHRQTNCTASPPANLPGSAELPVALAMALLRKTHGDMHQCQVAAVTGPVVAILLGAADGLALGPRDISRVRIILRRELRRLSSIINTNAVGIEKSSMTKQDCEAQINQVNSPRADAARTLVEWCSMPVVPSYSIGVHLVLGDADDAMLELAQKYAWIVRLLGSRARVNLHKEVPLLASTCKVLCDSNKDLVNSIADVLAMEKSLQRRVSFSEFSTEIPEESPEDIDTPWFRHHSEEIQC